VVGRKKRPLVVVGQKIGRGRKKWRRLVGVTRERNGLNRSVELMGYWA
jgi:hypothetical protein